MAKTYKILGQSMRFILEAGDAVSAELCGFDDASAGDILVLLLWKGNRPEKYVIHRAIFKSVIFGREIILTKGDGALLPDFPAGNLQVVGKVTSIRRANGGAFEISGIPVNRVWPVLSLFSAVAAKGLYLLVLSFFFFSKALYLLAPVFFYESLNSLYRFFEMPVYPRIVDFFSFLIFPGAGSPAGENSGVSGIKTGRIFRDETWSGEIQVVDYLQIMPGVSVKIMPGTKVNFKRSETSFFPVIRGTAGHIEEIETSNAKIINYGRMEAAGTEDARIAFGGESFGGVYSLGNGEAVFANSSFLSSRGPALYSGDYAFSRLKNCLFRGNGMNVLVSGSSTLFAEKCALEKPSELSLSVAGDSRALLSRCELSAPGAGLAEISGSSELALVSCSLSDAASGVSLKGKSSFYASGSVFSGLGNYALHSEGKGNTIKLESCRIFSNSNGISAGKSSFFSLRNCKLTDNAGTGVSISGTAKAFFESTLFERNGEGFSAEEGGEIRSFNSSFCANSVCGAKIGGFARVFFENCLIKGNVTGLETRNSGALSFKNSEISGNSLGAVFISGIEEAHFSGVKVFGNGNGITVFACSLFSFRDGWASDNSGTAFSLMKTKEAGFSGIKAERNGKGAVFGKGRKVFFENSSFLNNNYCGFAASDCSGAELNSCLFAGGRAGVEMKNVGRAVLNGVRISGNSSTGAGFKDSGEVLVSGGEISMNETGMRCEGCRYFSCLDASVSGNAAGGVSLTGPGKAFFSLSKFAGNGEGIVSHSIESLELEKLSLSGNRFCGLNLSDSKLVVVRESVIEGGDKGVYAGNCGEFRAEKLRVSGARLSGISFSGTRTALLFSSSLNENGEGIASKKVGTLFLKGLSFSGNGAFGVNISDCGRAEMEAAEIKGGRTAFHAENCRLLRLKEARTENNSFSGYSIKGAGKVFLSSCSARGGKDGLILKKTGFFFAADSEFSGNSSFGITLAETARAELKGCRAEKNRNGFSAENCPSVRLAGSYIGSNSGAGAALSGGREAVFLNSSFSANGEGLISKGPGRLRLEGSSFCGNKSFGINLSGADAARLRFCEIKGNKTGFHASGTGEIYAENTDISGNPGGGAVFSGAKLVSFFEGTVTGNGNGLEISDTGSFTARLIRVSGNALTAAALEKVREIRLKNSVFSDNRNGIHAEKTFFLAAEKNFFSHNGSSGASLIEVEKARFSGGGFFSNGEGLLYDKGGSLEVEKTVFSLNGKGVSASGGGKLSFSGCLVEENSQGLDLAGASSAVITDLGFSRNKKALRVAETKTFRLKKSFFRENAEGFSCFSPYSGKIDKVSFSKNGKALELSGFWRVSVSNSLFNLEGKDALLVSGERIRFKNTAIKGKVYPYLRLSVLRVFSKGFTFNGSEILFFREGGGERLARKLLPALIAVSSFPPAGYALSLVYLLALKAAAFVLPVKGVTGLYLYRGLASGDWVPVLSDIDLILITETGSAGFYPGFYRRYSALKKLFPFLGEILIGDSRVMGEFLNSWGLKGEDFFSGNRLLYGVSEIRKAPRSAAGKLSDINEALYAYTTLLANHFGGEPEELKKRNIFKSWVDINRFLDPGEERTLSRREYFSRKLSPAGAGEGFSPAEPLYNSFRLVSQGMKEYSPRVRECLFAPAEKDPSMDPEFEKLARGISSGLKFLLLPLYRSYIIVPDGFEKKEFEILVKNIGEAGPSLKNFNAAFPILSESAFRTFLGMPYLNNPFLHKSVCGKSSGNNLIDGRVYSNFTVEKFSAEKDFLQEAFRAACLHFSVTWRYSFAARRQRDLHYLYTRTCGLRLFGETGISPDMEDAVSLSREFNERLSPPNKSWGDFLKDGFSRENHEFISENIALVMTKYENKRSDNNL